MFAHVDASSDETTTTFFIFFVDDLATFVHGGKEREVENDFRQENRQLFQKYSKNQTHQWA